MYKVWKGTPPIWVAFFLHSDVEMCVDLCENVEYNVELIGACC